MSVYSLRLRLRDAYKCLYIRFVQLYNIIYVLKFSFLVKFFNI